MYWSFAVIVTILCIKTVFTLEDYINLATEKDVRDIRTFICENSTSTLACSQNRTLLIKSVMFGRMDSSICADNDTRVCQTPYSLSLVKDLCDGKEKCFIFASKIFFGQNCGSINSYVDVVYKCKNENSSKTGEFIFTNNKVVTQVGNPSQLIVAVGILATLFTISTVVLSVIGYKVWRRWRGPYGSSYTRNPDEDDDLDFSLYGEGRSAIQYDRISAGFTPIFTGNIHDRNFDS